MPPKIAKEDVLDDIRRVSAIVDSGPTYRDYQQHGEYSTWTIRNRFGSMSNARDKAGLDSGREYNLTEREILADLRSVYREIGSSPTQSEYREHGKYSVRTVHNHFDSWIEAREKANIPDGPEQNTRVKDEKLLADIRAVAKRIEAIPSQSAMREYGEYSDYVCADRFGTWTNAVREAGFEPRTIGAQTGEENGYWKGGYEPYYGPNWAEQRRAARGRDDYCCVACGMTDGEHKEVFGWELEVHHIKPFAECDNHREANDLENLITLCRTHHREYEELPAGECEKLKS